MRWAILAVASYAAAVAYSTVAAKADVITIGNTRFDFDAPSSPLTGGQQALFRAYKEAVNRHDEAGLMSLQDSSMSSCMAVGRKLIVQDLDSTIPDDAKVRFFDSSEDLAKEMGFGDLAYLSAQPSAVLGIMGGSKSEREVKIFTILRPVRQTGESFALIPYCLTEKGKALLDQKTGTQP